jgi:hypothetical protein
VSARKKKHDLMQEPSEYGSKAMPLFFLLLLLQYTQGSLFMVCVTSLF